jgi:phosphoribosylamine--glycine ligase
MKVLLVGSGGREHALAWAIARSPLLEELLIAPGNPGTAALGRNMAIPVNDFMALVDLARREQVDLAVVGPDNPLAEGLVDQLQAAGITAFGPTAAAARIESSKIFAKQIMAEAGIATAEAHAFDDPAAATAFARSSGRTWVVKADGLAFGKGVIVPADPDGTLAAIAQLAATPSGSRLLLEEYLAGPEVSLLALCDGERLLALPPARDYKRLGDGNTGPNTGGMGAVAPAPGVTDELATTIVRETMQPVVDRMAALGTPFRGALYAGLMLTEAGPRVLEFNARFGDPETQVVLPLIEGDLLAALLACAEGRLAPDMLRPRSGHAVCVVLAAAGYPGTPQRGDPIRGLETAGDDVLIFQAGTAMQEDGLVTSGGRVLGVTGFGTDFSTAREQAYAQADAIDFAGKQYRSDIGS